jgi:hypothetical protein
MIHDFRSLVFIASEGRVTTRFNVIERVLNWLNVFGLVDGTRILFVFLRSLICQLLPIALRRMLVHSLILVDNVICVVQGELALQIHFLLMKLKPGRFPDWELRVCIFDLNNIWWIGNAWRRISTSEFSLTLWEVGESCAGLHTEHGRVHLIRYDLLPIGLIGKVILSRAGHIQVGAVRSLNVFILFLVLR